MRGKRRNGSHFPQRDADWFLSSVLGQGVACLAVCGGRGSHVWLVGWSNVRSFWFNRQRTWRKCLVWPLDTAGPFDDDFCVTVVDSRNHFERKQLETV